MEFRTAIKPEPGERAITYKDRLFLIGSCFATEIGSWLKRSKFKTTINPFGVLYNPSSVADSLDILIERKVFTGENLHFYANKYLSFSHDTTFSSALENDALEGINNSIVLGSSSLKSANYLFVTFGTSRIYRFNESGRVVSNCHKIPAKEFTREILKPEDIVSRWRETIERLRDFNPGLQIIFTVSPVRHWKDGAHGNQLSKSILFVAIEELIKEKDVYYFPSYEIMMDDLRDYRFYKDDMLHPSKQAVKYIWDFFKSTYFGTSTVELLERILKITLSVEHRPVSTTDSELKLFGNNMMKKIREIEKINPDIDFKHEEEYFQSLI